MFNFRLSESSFSIWTEIDKTLNWGKDVYFSYNYLMSLKYNSKNQANMLITGMGVLNKQMADPPE